MLNEAMLKNSKGSKICMARCKDLCPETNEMLQVFSLSRPPSVPVLGRKLSSESIITVRDDEVYSVPYPIHLSHKKVRRKSVASNPCLNQIKRTTRKMKINVETQKHAEVKPANLRKVKSSRVLKKHKSEANIAIKPVKKHESPERKLLIKAIVQKSLKKQKKLKKVKESAKKFCNDHKEKLKKSIEELNKLTREKNLMKFKQKQFQPKLAWGADEVRLKNLAERQKSVNLLEKVNITPPRRPEKRKSPTKLNPSSDESCKKCPHSSRPEIKKFVVKQKKIRKKSQDQEEALKIEKENRRLSQLKYLDFVSRQIIEKKPKKKQKKKVLRRCPEVKWDQNFFEERIKCNEPFLFSKSSSIEHDDERVDGRQCNNFGHFDNYELLNSKIDSTAVVDNIVNKKSLPEVQLPKTSDSLPVDHHLEYSSQFEDKKHLESQSKNHSKLEDLSKKFESIKNKIQSIQKEAAKKPETIQSRAAVKIQAWFRGVLTRKSLVPQVSSVNNPNVYFNDSKSWLYQRQYPDNIDSFLEEDEEVKLIIGSFSKKSDTPKLTARFSPTSHLQLQISPLIEGQSLNLSEISHRLALEEQNLLKLEEESKEIEKLQTPIKLKRKPEQLEVLRSRDLEEIKEIAGDTGSESEIIRIFQEILKRRSASIDQMFMQNIKAVKDALEQTVSNDERSDLKRTLIKLAEENQTEDLDELLKQLIGTKYIKELEEQIVKDFGSGTVIFDHDLSLSVNLSSILFPTRPLPIDTIYSSEEPLYPIAMLDQILSQESSHLGSFVMSPSSVIWVESMPFNESSNLTELLTSYTLVELEEIIYQDAINQVFQVTSEFIMNFAEELLMFIMSNEIKAASEEFHQSINESRIVKFIEEVFNENEDEIIAKVMTTSIENPLEVLSMMQESEIGLGYFQELFDPPLSPRILLGFFKDDSPYMCIFLKLLFDCFNESLHSMIPKRNMPWSCYKDPLSLLKKPEDLLKSLKDEILLWDSSRMGKIIDSEALGVTNEASNQFREEQLTKVLAREVCENDPGWINYEFDETQLKLDIADMALELLVDEMIDIVDL